MVLDKKKKVIEAMQKAEEVKRREIERALKVSEIQIPKKREFYPYPSEYIKFIEEVKIKPTTFYEKVCHLVENIFPIEPSKETKVKIGDSLRAAYINANPKGVFSLAILSTIIIIVFVMFSIVFFNIGLVFGLFGFIVALGAFWYLYKYPSSKAKSMGIRMSADSVLAILYMVIYMRASPNLEGAIKFASQNLEGPLAWDLRKLLWDIEVGRYSSASDAMIDYINKWKDKNKEFSEALNMLRGSAVEQARREIVYDETINIILNGTRERARHYAADLRMPMTLIYAMGVLLPVMGLVLFPIVLIFIADQVKPSFVFFGYDILLPLSLYFIVSHILSSKPPTFSPPDISKAKGVPPMGKFALGSINIPIWPIALVLSLPFIFTGITGLTNPDTYYSVSFSITIIFGLSLIIIAYTFLDSYQKSRVRKDIEKIENEFATALFQLGNILGGGTPLEFAVDRVRVNLKELKIAEMFEIASLNMKKFGYTFEEAMFDKEVGAIWYYPSKLIHSIMQTIIQSAKKSVKTAASSMVVISRYLKGVHEVKEEIDDMLGETTSSMRFLAMFLSPMVAGVTITMAVVILQILTQLGAAMTQITTMSSGLNTAQTFFLVPWAMGGTLPITPPVFQMIVGIYMIETAVLLAVFLNGVQYGEDPVGVRSSIWTILLLGMIIYIISWMVTYSMFGGAISSLLTPVGGAK
jgi:Flp pilus assembly protein TadB